MRLIARVLVGCVAIVTTLVGAIALGDDKAEPLAIALLGQTAKELTQDQNAIGALSSQQICNRPLSSVVNLSPSGSFISVFQSPEFEPKLNDTKSVELLKVQNGLRGLGIFKVTPLGWARTTDSYYLRKIDGAVIKIDPQTALVEEVQTLSSQINHYGRNRQFLGGHAGYVVFGPQIWDKNLVLVDVEHPDHILRIPTNFTKINRVSISCGANVSSADICTVSIMMQDTLNETPLAKAEAQVQIARISTRTGQVISQQTLRSPKLVAADYVGRFSEGVDIWLGYGGENRNMFLVDQSGSVAELPSPIGDIKEAYLDANNSLIIESFSNQVARAGKFNPSTVNHELTPRWIKIGRHLPVQGPSGLRLINLGEDPVQSGVEEGSRTHGEVSFGCQSNHSKHTWVPLGRSGYHEFLPETGQPRGLLVYLHGGPYSRYSPSPSNILLPWLAKGYKVWVPEHPGTPGFGLSYMMPTPDLINEEINLLASRIQFEQSTLKKGNSDEFSTAFLGNSFGGFTLIQLSKILPQSPRTVFALVNAPCRNYSSMLSARGKSMRYAHVKAVGTAYQELSLRNNHDFDLCAAESDAPIFVFRSENDETVGPQSAMRIAKASASNVVVLKNETHNISLAGAEMILETVLGQMERQ